MLYTDDLVEASLSGDDGASLTGRLVHAVTGLRGLPLEELPAALVHAMGADHPDDDVAVMAVEV